TMIGTVGTNETENKAFITLSAALSSHGVSVPRVVSISDDNMSYLQEDLGDTTLYDIILRDGYSPRVIDLFKASLTELLNFQTVGAVHTDDDCYFPVKSLSGASILWDLNYFKYCFAKVIGCEINEVELEKEFTRLSDSISSATPKALILRDFQSRNIMIADDKPWLIDFQGARRGPILYDVISCLMQARINMPQKLRDELLEFYISLAAERFDVESAQLTDSVNDLSIFRLLQVLGTYGFRGLIQGKTNFISPIETALKSLAPLLQKDNIKYPYLLAIIEEAITKVQAIGCQQFKIYDNQLNVVVTSFSYKKGIPTDQSDNGGGFVFDCRAIHNPGRYEQYKHLTGEDKSVIDFLERDGEIQPFLAYCKGLIDMSVTKYIKRGFTHLEIAFGCTGGQHRSVYSARHMADYIADKYGVHVTLYHREQNIIREYNAPTL
ncbi:MAG: phosphotransferase, partial [Muribaculaceae bacterium]|nr:phosphotransferase [Muribaculaceae bacterium]